VKTHIQVARMMDGGGNTAASLSQAEEGVLRLQHTLDQLLTLARVEGPFNFDTEQVANPGAIAQLAVQQLSPACRGRVILKEAVVTGNILVPAVLAVTALRNLLDNALRYSPADTAVVLSMKKADAALCFEVDDEGPGMTEADRSHALQRFWRKGRGQGSGLGLSIVVAITERYGGAFDLRARPGQGTTARITLPLA